MYSCTPHKKNTALTVSPSAPTTRGHKLSRPPTTQFISPFPERNAFLDSVMRKLSASHIWLADSHCNSTAPVLIKAGRHDDNDDHGGDANDDRIDKVPQRRSKQVVVHKAAMAAATHRIADAYSWCPLLTQFFCVLCVRLYKLI